MVSTSPCIPVCISHVPLSKQPSRSCQAHVSACCRNPGQGARRVINLEARAAPPNQAEPAPISTSRSDGSTASDGTDQAELDESPHVPTGVSNGDDVFQSAEDELEPNTVRAKTNAQVSSGQVAERMAADVP